MYKVLKDFKVNYTTGDIIPLPEDKAKKILAAGGFIEKVEESDKKEKEDNKKNEEKTANKEEGSELNNIDLEDIDN